MLNQKIKSEFIPTKILNTGDRIPIIGLGTFGSDYYSNQEIADAVKFALENGYRHIDCASVYGNEKEIGQAINEVISNGTLSRDELWITSKVWNDKHGEGEVIKSCKQSLKDLKLDYLDLYLVHWPFPNYHPPGCDGNERNPNSVPYKHEDYMVVWRQMEQLVEMGLVKNIGTSNMTIPKMKLLLNDVKIKPAVNEMELHPHFQQKELYNFIVENNIVPIGFSPIGSPRRPERDKTENDTVVIEDPVIIKIAKKLKVHPAIICLKWGMQRGHVVIPFSVKPQQILSNLKAAIGNHLTKDEMNEISQIDKNCRFIKGQVFLWKGAKGWEDIWDVNGVISS